MVTAADAVKTVENTDVANTPCGVAAHFVKIDENWGVKIFKYADEKGRDEIYHRQEVAAKHGLGPRVGDKIALSNDRHGYITEIAETYEDYVKRGEVFKPFLPKERIEFTENLQRIYDEEGVDCYVQDLHDFNVGYIDGKIVCIDFGFD